MPGLSPMPAYLLYRACPPFQVGLLYQGGRPHRVFLQVAGSPAGDLPRRVVHQHRASHRPAPAIAARPHNPAHPRQGPRQPSLHLINLFHPAAVGSRIAEPALGSVSMPRDRACSPLLSRRPWRLSGRMNQVVETSLGQESKDAAEGEMRHCSVEPALNAILRAGSESMNSWKGCGEQRRRDRQLHRPGSRLRNRHPGHRRAKKRLRSSRKRQKIRIMWAEPKELAFSCAPPSFT